MFVRKRHPLSYRISTSKGLKSTYPRFIKWCFFNKKELRIFRKLIDLQKGIDLAADESYLHTGALDVEKITVEVEKQQQYLKENPVDLRRYELFLLHIEEKRRKNPNADPAKKYGIDPHIYSMYIDSSVLSCL